MHLLQTLMRLLSSASPKVTGSLESEDTNVTSASQGMANLEPAFLLAPPEGISLVGWNRDLFLPSQVAGEQKSFSFGSFSWLFCTEVYLGDIESPLALCQCSPSLCPMHALFDANPLFLLEPQPVFLSPAAMPLTALTSFSY